MPRLREFMFISNKYLNEIYIEICHQVCINVTIVLSVHMYMFSLDRVASSKCALVDMIEIVVLKLSEDLESANH
jgi:hypothetical protein